MNIRRCARCKLLLVARPGLTMAERCAKHSPNGSSPGRASLGTTLRPCFENHVERRAGDLAGWREAAFAEDFAKTLRIRLSTKRLANFLIERCRHYA
jgi:hypothetical protein